MVTACTLALSPYFVTRYPNSVCFASKLIFTRNNFLTAWLHNKTPLAMQARLHLKSRQMIILPIKVK